MIMSKVTISIAPDTVYFLHHVMKWIVSVSLVFFQLASLVGGQTSFLSETENRKTEKRLRDYAAGVVSFEEISGAANSTNLISITNLARYYQTHSNSIGVKELLPISRCLVLTGNHLDATSAASAYLNIYSNDCRGWNILFAANLGTSNYGKALEAGTNSLRFGCDDNLVPLGMLALEAKQHAIIESEILPRLMIRKDVETDVEIRREVLNFLVAFSVQRQNEELFVKALRGVSARDLGRNQDLRQWIKRGCGIFRAKETEKLCEQLR